MAPNTAIVKSVEQLGYRVTVGDVASDAGLEFNETQQGLLTLASDAGGHLQVADSGDIVYLFPENFRTILRNKYWQLQWREWWGKVGKSLFFLLRISFGIVLILSIILMAVTVIFILISINSSDRRDGEGDNSYRGSGGGGLYFMPRFWLGPDLFWWLDPGYDSYYQRRYQASVRHKEPPKISFLEAIFSFLFGDGNPNWNLEEGRWQEIGKVIRNHGGAVVAQQLAPYVYELDPRSELYEYEEYMLPVLARFNGYPEVSPQGGIIYYFPDLQVSAFQHKQLSVNQYLQELPWRFSEAR
ncbi:MAG: hypothetical protein F6K24_39085, partial [Okeania sp. SIO2D1]|nr:hypothetical protein [Okeania sp. SIO2D1]